MRKFTILLMAISFWLMASSSVALAASLSLDPATGTFNQGCAFSINVMLDTQGTQTDGTDAILEFDSSRFTGQNIVNGTIYPDFPGNNIDNSAGKITILSLASVNTPFSGKGILATINFTVKDSAPAGSTQITFDFDPNDKAKTTDSNVVERTTIADVLNSVGNGDYIIGTGTCGSQPSVAPSVAPYKRPVGAPDMGTPAAQPRTIDQYVDRTGKGAGTPQLTFTLAIFGSVLTVLGILGLALL